MAWDYIIIGAGSAGCVLANRLSRDPKTKVLLIEAGGSDRNPLNRIPMYGTFRHMGSKNDWNFATEPDPSRKGRVDAWPRGKMLGGSSSINGMIYVRGDRDDYNHWAQLGNRGWSFADVLPFFRENENYAFEDEDARGELKVRPMQGAHPLSERFVRSCVELGIPENAHYNGERQEGATILHMSQSSRVRHSASQAFLMPAKSRSNLKVLTGALVHKILIEAGEARGVRLSRGGAVRDEMAAREVILSAGSIGSPQILMLSGVGPAEDLNAHGIKVACASPGVGRNLHEHACAIMQWRVRTPTLNVEWGKPAAALRHGFNWLAFGKGPLTAVSFQALCFAKTAPELSHPDVQIHFAPVGYTKGAEGIRFYRFPAVTMQPNVNRSRSRGHLTLASADPAAPPAIHPNMLGDAHDLETLVAGARLCRRIMRETSFGEEFVEEIAPGDEVRSDDEWRDFVTERAGPAYHPVGTCKMGVDDMAVVDPELRVRGVGRLRVIDASIMPAVTSGNTNAPTMMIAAKGAAMIAAAG